MKNILLLIADFYPAPSPNVTCFKPFINKWLNSGYNIEVVTSDVDGIEHPFNQKNINVHRVKDKKMRNHLYWLKKIENSNFSLKRKILTYLSYVSKLFYEIIYYDPSVERSYRGWRRKKVKSLVESLLLRKNIDYVISISHPFCTHDIIYELHKKYSFIWYMLEYDSYGINEFLFTDNKEKRINKEKLYFKESDKVLLTPQLYKAYNDGIYNDFKDKFYKLEFANLTRHQIKVNSKSIFTKNNKIKLFYAGAFNTIIRNPTKVFEFLNKLNNEYEFIVVTKRNLDFAQDSITNLGDKINIHPRLDFDTVYYNQTITDFLVSIGNSITYQSPGKTLELLSTGRPIIHFSFIENDPVVDYLIKYPNKFIVNLYQDWDNQILELGDFLNITFDTIDFDKILKICNEFSPEKILNDFKELF